MRVNGVTTPVDPEIDLRTADKQMSKIFGEQVERFRPDLIHFHCVQRLTPSVCLEALARKIPYVVTVHDGWWISHNQFLLDNDNRYSVYDLEDPVGQLLEYGAGRFGRMKELRFVLDNAKQVLAVSSPFARVYRDLGFTNVRVVENGVSDLPVLKRASFDTTKVRLAHIGGRSFHKGFNHLRAALSDLKCHNIEVLLIDHALSPGEENLTVWGASIVKVRGKFPQTKVGELYAMVDVLVAPSVWPESYGLVVREALQAGCWIIASDRGALSEAVDENCGFVVPIDNYEALKGVLTEIDSQPHRYKESPKAVPRFRCSRQQADDLMEVYREFTGAGKTATSGEPKVVRGGVKGAAV